MTPDTRSKTEGLGRRMLEKALLPVVAAAATAATTYAARKAPQLLDQKFGPRLRELAGEAGDVAQDLPERAKSAAGETGDLAGQLSERVTSVAGSRKRTTTRTLSTDELARRRAERERHRSSRGRTSR